LTKQNTHTHLSPQLKTHTPLSPTQNTHTYLSIQTQTQTSTIAELTAGAVVVSHRIQLL